MSGPSSKSPRELRPVAFSRRLVSHKKTRTAVASSGIGFAVLVIFMQLGFYGAVTNTALAVSSRLDADLIVVSPRFVHLNEPGSIHRARLFQVLADPEVASATPIYVGYAPWRDPESGEHCRIFALGFPLAEAKLNLPLRMPEVGEQLDALRPTNALLFDRLSQGECGPTLASGEAEVRNQAVRVVGHFDMGIGFLADGAMISSDDTFSRIFGDHPLDRPHLGLIRLRKGSDVEAAAKRIDRSLPADVRVITKRELNAYQTEHWVENTAVGNIFGMGTIAGFFVGVVVLFQILSADIRNQLPLYATLRAMGYANRQLYRWVLEQAWFFAALGYLPALGFSLALFPLIHQLTHLPIYLTFGLAGFVLLLAFVMCSLAALLSIRRLRRVDPAELF